MKPAAMQQGIAAALAFMLPFLGPSTWWGINLCSLLYLLVALCYWRQCRSVLMQHWGALRWVLIAFVAYFLFAFLGLLLRPETTAASVEKPARMLLGVAALALVLAFRPHRSALWWGVVGGAFGGALAVGVQRLAFGIARPGGFLNAIPAGDLLVCLALVALAAAADPRAGIKPVWLALGALAGLAGALMTGTRGGLVALLPAASCSPDMAARMAARARACWCWRASRWCCSSTRFRRAGRRRA